MELTTCSAKTFPTLIQSYRAKGKTKRLTQALSASISGLAGFRYSPDIEAPVQCCDGVANNPPQFSTTTFKVQNRHFIFSNFAQNFRAVFVCRKTELAEISVSPVCSTTYALVMYLFCLQATPAIRAIPLFHRLSKRRK